MVELEPISEADEETFTLSDDDPASHRSVG